MSRGQAHTDSPTGRQYHIRYRLLGHDGSLYWSPVFEDDQAAFQQLAWYRQQDHVTQADLFVRDVSPWCPAP